MTEVAAQVGVSRQTVARGLKSYAHAGSSPIRR
ncbi:hypothetical protein [Streptomyces sp. NPDC050546]